MLVESPLGHTCFNVPTDSTGEPRWDLAYEPRVLLHNMCGGSGKPKAIFDEWKPNDKANRACKEHTSQGH